MLTKIVDIPTSEVESSKEKNTLYGGNYPPSQKTMGLPVDECVNV